MIEQVGVIFHPRGQTAGALHHVKSQVKFRRPAVELHLSELQPGPGDRFQRGAFEGEHHLKQRRVAQASFRLQFLDQFFERHFGVGKSAHGGYPHAIQQLAKRRVAGQLAA